MDTRTLTVVVDHPNPALREQAFAYSLRMSLISSTGALQWPTAGFALFPLIDVRLTIRTILTRLPAPPAHPSDRPDVDLSAPAIPFADRHRDLVPPSADLTIRLDFDALDAEHAAERNHQRQMLGGESVDPPLTTWIYNNSVETHLSARHDDWVASTPRPSDGRFSSVAHRNVRPRRDSPPSDST
jgi:hypothetical protein